MKQIAVFAVTAAAALVWAAGASAARYPLAGTEADPVYWKQIPTGEDVQRAYPRDQINGRAVIRCKLDDQGLLVDCAVISEEPTGHGFGDAALKLSQKFKAETKSVSGKPSAGLVVEVPVRLQVE